MIKLSGSVYFAVGLSIIFASIYYENFDLIKKISEPEMEAAIALMAFLASSIIIFIGLMSSGDLAKKIAKKDKAVYFLLLSELTKLGVSSYLVAFYSLLVMIFELWGLWSTSLWIFLLTYMTVKFINTVFLIKKVISLDVSFSELN